MLKESGENEILFVVGSTESGRPRFLIMPVTFEIRFSDVNGAVQDSGGLNNVASGYTSSVGVYGLSQKR